MPLKKKPTSRTRAKIRSRRKPVTKAMKRVAKRAGGVSRRKLARRPTSGKALTAPGSPIEVFEVVETEIYEEPELEIIEEEEAS